MNMPSLYRRGTSRSPYASITRRDDHRTLRSPDTSVTGSPNWRSSRLLCRSRRLFGRTLASLACGTINNFRYDLGLRHEHGMAARRFDHGRPDAFGHMLQHTRAEGLVVLGDHCPTRLGTPGCMFELRFKH